MLNTESSPLSQLQLDFVYLKALSYPSVSNRDVIIEWRIRLGV